jgi:SpoVK/Ycf46/Vps4 family AAA+-type ATPase
VRSATADLVLRPELLDRLGPAVNSGRSIFLYGPSGDGKTAIAEAIGRHLMGGEILVPYAVGMDGQLVKVYDSLSHQAATSAAPAGATYADARWVRCQRPVVMAGGELTLASLDLVYNDTAKYYEAPFQMKANGGMFLLDDFGRQQVAPRDLLNRWIVPLEKRLDFLTLHTGKKVEVPFDVLIVFATNIAPKELVDEAFLSRIRHKIEIGNPSLDEFRLNLERVAARRGIPFSEQGFAHLIEEHYMKSGREMKSVHPRDLLDQIVDIAEYRRVAPEMSSELIDEACGSYFVAL